MPMEITSANNQRNNMLMSKLRLINSLIKIARLVTRLARGPGGKIAVP